MLVAASASALVCASVCEWSLLSWLVSKNKTKKNENKKTGNGSEYKHAAAALVFAPPVRHPNTIPFPVPSLSESASQYNPVQFSPFHGTPRYVLRTYPGGAKNGQGGDGSGMVVDWDWDSSGLELDRRELVLGWRGGGWRYLQKQRAYQRRWYRIAY